MSISHHYCAQYVICWFATILCIYMAAVSFMFMFMDSLILFGINGPLNKNTV